MQARIIIKLFYLTYKKQLVEFLIPLIALLTLFFLTLKEYFIFSWFSYFGILLLPFVLQIRDGNTKSIRYLYVMLFFLFLAYFSPIHTLLYLAWISAFLFLVENSFGKTSILSFIYLIVISPIFIYFGNFFGIPARLELTELSSTILNFINFKNEVIGNLIITKGSEFSVDPACMGLNMLNMSFMLAIVMAFHCERLYGSRLSIFVSFCYFGIVFLVNLIGNLIRIILLVLFHIEAENTMHDAVGIICLVIYVLLPLWFIANYLFKKFGSKNTISHKSLSSKIVLLLNFSAIILFITVGYTVKSKINTICYLPSQCSIDGYNKSIVGKDVLKFEDSRSLVYVKPVSSFYGAEHTPMICWVGSGYSFKQIKKVMIMEREIFVGKLIKGDDILYCSWWFDNGVSKTINQFEWRWDVIRGSNPYSLVNVNTTDEKLLYSRTIEMLAKNIFIK